jgi:hypothetical protein
MMMKSCVLLIFFGTILDLFWSIVDAQGQLRVESFPLSDNVPYDCETVISTHTFSGTCCALNTTDGGGCVVNVADGNCVVRTSLGLWIVLLWFPPTCWRFVMLMRLTCCGCCGCCSLSLSFFLYMCVSIHIQTILCCSRLGIIYLFGLFYGTDQRTIFYFGLYFHL